MMRRLVNTLINKLCRSELRESILGDLEELYELDQHRNPKKADRNYLFNAVAFLRYHRLRKKQMSKTRNHMSLFNNYVKVSFRDLIRHKVYSIINLVGMVSGWAVALLILQYVLFETGFDRFHPDADQIYRVVNDRYQNGSLIQHGTITYPTIGPTLYEDFPEVEAYTRMTNGNRTYLSYQDELYLTTTYLAADEHFLGFFNFPLLHGDPGTALDEPYQAVVTESFAKRLLPSNAAVSELIGKSIVVYGQQAKVTGIAQDVPAQSHLQFELLISYKTFIAVSGEGADNSWQWSDFYHYVKLTEGVTPGSIQGKLEEFGIRYFKKGEVSGGEERFHLQPMLRAHLDNGMEYEIGETVDGQIIWVMLAIACFIVVVAWINYINLTSSRSLQRAREIGIRRSVGADSGHVIGQYITETLLFNLISLLLAGGLVVLLQPYFNDMTGIPLSVEVLWNSQVWGLPFMVIFLLLFLTCCVLVSIYPAWLITRFKAKDIAHGRYKLQGEARWLRKGLVIFQFVVAIVLINAAFAITRQVDYMVEKEVGMDMDHVMVVYGPEMTNWDSTFIGKVDRFKNEVTSISGVNRVASSSRLAGDRLGRMFRVRSNSNPEARDLTFNFMEVDHDFEEVYGLTLLAGRGFEPTDHHYNGDFISSIVINQAAVAHLGLTLDEAVGSSAHFNQKDWTIIGVVNDFHQLSLHDAIEPIMFLPYYATYSNFSIKLAGEPSEATLARIHEIYNTIYPGNYFDYYFLEDAYRRQYQADFRLGKIGNVFTALSIIMVFLGLYGLLTMTLDRKVKEIGIRKVLGARIDHILMVLSREFFLLMIMALMVGIPISLYGIAQWKEGFAYAATFGVEWFVLSSVLVVLISLLPLLIQSKKVVMNNPVDSLRNE